MYHHGVSLMPTAIDGELTRGHPLFFHAIAALWMNIFGDSHIAMHSFALLISVLFLVAIYEAGLRVFNQRTAVLATILAAVQVVFFIQSSFVLFEMLVAFLCFLSIYFYVRERFILTALCLSALFYTKESGLIAGFVIGIDALISLFDKKYDWKQKLSRCVAVAVPCLLIATFFIIQKHIRGWYILPLYNDLIPHKWDSFWYNLNVLAIHSTVVRDLRHCYFILVLVLSVLVTIRKKDYRYLVIFLPFIAFYFCIDGETVHILSGVPFFCLLIISMVAALYVFTKLRVFQDEKQTQLITLFCAFVFCFLCFSAMNFFTPRYMLAAIVPLLFIAAALIERFTTLTWKILFYPSLLIIFTVAFFAFKDNKEFGDPDPRAFDGLEVHEKVVEFFEQNKYYDRAIGGTFLETQHLINPATGFLRTDRYFTKVRWEIDQNSEFAIFDNLEPDYRYPVFNRDSSFTLVFRHQKGKAWGEVYQRK